jgi:hypothetical protein
MRTIIDRNNTEVKVDYIPPDSAGARGPGQRIPNPEDAVLEFTSPGRRVLIDIAPFDFDKITDQELLELLERHSNSTLK